MTPEQRLQAAIEKLEALRGAGTPAPWTTTWGSATVPAADDLGSGDADLIVTLHRTIDAQLAILYRALNRNAPERDAAEMLADAILGGTQ